MCALKKSTGDRTDRRLPPSHRRREGDRGLEPAGRPRATVRLAVDDACALAKQRGIEIWADISCTVPTTARFDHERVRELLSELLSHCLRIIAHGSVGALVRRRGPDEIVVEVIHSGPGLKLRDFERLSHEPAHSLGRARALARQLGVNLVYERSHRGSGIYRFRFPIEPAGEKAKESLSWALMPEPPLAGHALLVDADGENRRLLRRLLEDLGVVVTVAEEGMGAIDRALFENVDIVLMGLQTPGMNAFGTARVLRRAGFDKPIYGLSREVDAKLRARSRHAGLDGILIRPLDRLTLIDIGSRHLPKRRRKSN